jgi:hypothetical protein
MTGKKLFLSLTFAAFANLFQAHCQQTTGLGSACVPAPPGLVGWWPGDGNVKDILGHDDGVQTNVGFASGQVGQAFRFIGTNSFVRVPTLEVFRTLTNVTLECWVFNDQVKPLRRVLTLTPDHVILAIDSAGKPFLNVRFGDLVATPTGQEFHDVTVTDSKVMVANIWHHLAGTYDGKSVLLYLDGQLVAATNAPGKLDSRGAGTEVYINFFDAGEVAGLIDEAAIYNRALTAEEIQSHFAAGSAGMCKAPVFTGIGAFFPGYVRLPIKGKAGKTVVIQSSTNLIQWSPIGTVPNATGEIEFTDPSAGAFARRFYRALEQ